MMCRIVIGSQHLLAKISITKPLKQGKLRSKKHQTMMLFIKRKSLVVRMHCLHTYTYNIYIVPDTCTFHIGYVLLQWLQMLPAATPKAKA